MSDATPTPPEYNVTGQDYADRRHLCYHGPLIDIHSHVTMTAPSDTAAGPAGGAGPAGSPDQAARMLDIAATFGVVRTYTMCPPQDIAPLRAALGDRLGFNAMLSKKPDDPDDAALRQADAFLEAGIDIVKLWAAPRGRDRGLTLDAPWRLAALRRVIDAGMRVVMVHVGDPDRWWHTVYTDTAKYGTKADQYVPLKRLMQEYSHCTWIGAHLGGDPEHPDHLQELFEAHPNYVVDTSATKWVVREVSRHPDAFRSLVERFPDRFLWGSDLVTRHALAEEHYVSRYWSQRTLWESTWAGASPIADPDHVPGDGGGPTPALRGVGLSGDVLAAVYHGNARRVMGLIEQPEMT